MLGRVLFVGFLLEHVGFYIDYGVRAPSDEAWASVNVEGDAMVG